MGAKGSWLLKFAVLAASAGLFAALIDQLAAGVVLYVAALTAIGVFVRVYARPAWRKYGKPLMRLADHMDMMEAGQAELVGQVAEVRAHTQRIEAECVVAADRAESAMEIANAVRVQLGVGLPDERPDP